MQSSVTFVTAIMDTKSAVKEETLQYRIDSLCLFLNSFQGEILIFTDRENIDLIKFIYKNIDRGQNIKIQLFDYPTESWIYRESLPYRDLLPTTRNQAKDTFQHLCLTQMKIEFLNRAIEICGNNTFFWIDSNICHLFNESLSHSINFLNYLSSQTFVKTPFIAMPYCWEKQNSVNFDNVCWRFCGAVMIGNNTGIANLHNLYQQFYSGLLKEKNRLSWDINVLAHFESIGIFSPVLYRANHNSSIVQIPTHLYYSCLSNGTADNTIIHYDYPEISGFFPSSASYLQRTSDKILCVRYVNYKIDNSDKYTVYNTNGQLQTINVICSLSDDLASIKDTQVIDEHAIGIPTYMEDAKYIGLEDVRLFGNMNFVASSATYTSDHSIRIIKGKIVGTSFTEGIVLKPPNGIYTHCEKNWIPLDENDCYIYRWHPYEIIRADDRGITSVISSKVIPNTLFEKVRGSTVPVWSNSDCCYITVVHWTERSAERGLLQYYHMLVKLNKKYDVVMWSQPFCFTRIGIQYCLGFCLINSETYGFWFSENDGNPQFMRSCSSQFSFV